MNEKLGQEPAFPMKLNQVIGQTSYNFTDENGNEQIGHYNNYADIVYQGMSKRFYAACAAMQGILSGMDCQSMVGYRSTDTSGVVELSYLMADELLKQEDKE